MSEPVTDYLIHTTLQEISITKERFFGEESYILLFDYYLAISFLYESCAILARAMVNQDKFNTFSKMLPPRDLPIKFWQDRANERLIRYKQRYNKEPSTFNEFIFNRLVQARTGIHPDDAWEASRNKKAKVFKTYDKKIPININLEVEQPILPTSKEKQHEIKWFVMEGIGFGSFFAELTKKMNDNYWESVRFDMDRLSERYSNGWGTADVPKLIILSFEEQEKLVTQAIAYWTKECFPELLEPLGLGDYRQLNGYKTFKLSDDYTRRWFHLIRAVADINLLHGLPY